MSPNDLLMGCERLKWVSDNQWDKGFPATGCRTTATFATTGQRVITATAVDANGLSAQASVVVNVDEVPPHSRPVVTILFPFNEALLSPSTPVRLSGAVNPGAGPVKWRWTAGDKPEVVLGTNPELDWTPSSLVSFSCGGSPITLRLYATNAAGTSRASARVYIQYPVC